MIAAELAGCAAGQHHRAGISAMEKGAYVDAVKELELASELEPEDVRFRQDYLVSKEKAAQKLSALAEAEFAAGKNAEADQYFRILLKVDRDNPQAIAGLDMIARAARATEDVAQAREALKRGDVVLAQQWVARALERVPEQPEAKAVQHEIEAQQSKELLLTPSLSAVYKKPINLEFRDASIKNVFEALSRTTGINFIFDHDVKSDQRTTVFLKQTTLEDAVDVILTTSQLDKKILNDTSVLIYPNNAAKTKEYQDLVVKVFYIANSDVKQTASMLKTVLKIKDVYVDEKANMLVLRENPDTIILADKLIALQDVDEPEVMLDVEVLEITRSRAQDLGIQLSNQLTITPLPSIVTTTPGTGTGTGATNGTQTIPLNDLRHINSSLLGVTLPTATLNFQKTDSDVNLLANPRIRVRDREKAKILIGDKVPVVTTTSSATGFVAENIQYIDVGIKLDVEPEIHLHDEISLKLGLEVSSLVSTITTSNGSQAYQIGTRNFNSALRLKDGETQILGGLISKSDTSNANRLPILGEIPLLGRLFSNQNDNAEKTEVVLSITPHLIRNIQRKDPSAESFWSGTEAALRTKPLQLHKIENTPAQAGAGAVRKVSGQTSNQPQPNTAPNSSSNANVPTLPPATVPNMTQAGNLKVFWKGPAQTKVGETISLELDIDALDPLKTVPLQLAFNPAEFEVIAIKEGDFFGKSGKSSFNQAIDKQSGRVSVGGGSDNPAGAKGSGTLLTIELKALQPTNEANISLIGLTPIGGAQPMTRLTLPIAHKIEVVQ
ncbi:MAG TPA: secretin and TonB N-terminal domain-containing protein [Burkholderiaceae bacterium]|jgi:general secretion pathway protein D